ncbi:hypothetical protein EZY14_018015 [Kordia sp. TARA_039_SRF]|nr:hypothetical protein EZY14_018015 [Kordia sp. TARA_039_SRF]
MSALELRNKIIQLLSTDNESYLQTVLEFAKRKKSETSDTIVAHTVEGKPLTKSMYIEEVKTAEKSVKAGNFTTVEDLEKEAENW